MTNAARILYQVIEHHGVGARDGSIRKVAATEFVYGSAKHRIGGNHSRFTQTAGVAADQVAASSRDGSTGSNSAVSMSAMTCGTQPVSKVTPSAVKIFVAFIPILFIQTQHCFYFLLSDLFLFCHSSP